MAAQDYYDLVQQFYVGFYGRPADMEGLDYWAGRVDLFDGDFSAVQAAFANSAEAQDFVFNDPDSGDALSNTELVNNIYQNLFGRSAGSEGLDFYVPRLDSGEYSLDDVVKRVIDGAQNEDATTIDNKVKVAQYFTDNLGDVPYENDDIIEARDVLDGVGADNASVLAGFDDADSTIQDMADEAGVSTGDTFTLTASADDLTGTSDNDIFNAKPEADTAGGGNLVDTLQNVDIIDGGAGEDTLNVTFANASSPSASLSNVENVNVRFTAAATLNLQNASGVEEVTVQKSTDAGTVSSIAASTGVTLKDSVQNATLEYVDSALDGASDSVALSVENYGNSSTTANVTIDDVNDTGNVVEGLEIAATGSNVVDVTGAGNAVETLTVSGNGSLDVTVGVTALDTVDASSNSGGVTTDLNASLNNLTVTGGSGDDDITVGSGDDEVALGGGDDKVTFAGNLDASDSVDGGEGTDTLAITGNLASGLSLSSLETLEMTTDGDNTADMDSGAFETYRFVAATNTHTVAVSNYLDESLVVDSSTALDSLTITQKEVTSSDVANVTVANSTNDGSDGGETTTTLDSLTATSAETVNLTLSTDEANFDGTDEVAVDEIATTGADVVIDGNASATLGTDTTVTNGDIDASAATGNLTFKLGSADQALLGGAGDDTFEFGAEGDASDSVNGGDGDDTITQTVASSASGVSVDASNVETVEVATTTDDATASYDASNLSGVSTLKLSTTTNDSTPGGNNDLTEVTGLTDGVSEVLLSGDFDSGNDGIVSLALDDASGDADALAIALDGGTNGDDTEDTFTQDIYNLTTADVEDVTLSIDSGIDDTTVNIDNLDVTGAESLTIAGTDTTTAVSVSALANDDDVATIDASSITGDLTLGELGKGGITLEIDSGEISDAIVTAGNEDTKDITLDSTDAARDTIVFGESVGDVSIANFTANNSVVGDVLDLSAFGVTSSDDLVFSASGGDTEITTAADDAFDMITLTGVNPAEVTDANFIFA